MKNVAVLAAWILLAALAGAQASRPRPDGPDRIHQLRCDQSLVREFVDSALSLAAEQDSLRRADRCTRLAERLADEIERAAEEQKEYRVLELADQLQLLVRDAIAGILSRERSRMPPPSIREQELRRVHDHIVRILRPVESRLHHIAGAEPGRRALEAISDSKAEVEKALP